MSDGAKTETLTLATAMDVLAREIQSGDGIANAAITEAAQRLRDQEQDSAKLRQEIRRLREDIDSLAYWSRSMTETRSTLRDRIAAVAARKS